MTRIRRISVVSGIAGLALFMLLGCGLQSSDRGGGPAGNGWYIRLNVLAPRTVTVSEYQVTGLTIEVRDPEDAVLQTITWNAAEGPQSYVIPVERQGAHKVNVTHHGTANSETVEATESAAVNIEAMVITVIDIVPGSIGVINVEGGGQDCYISFKYDGAPVTFKEGFLEAGNVAFAAVESGWQYHDQGPVYDRTHIVAFLEGLSLSEEVHGNYGVEIVLIGDVGSQPPDPGTYTFSDRYHGIYNVGYDTPDSYVSVSDGDSDAASVTLTTVGAVGGFIEGTFSATVVEKDALATHSITEGQFRVKHIELPPMGP